MSALETIDAELNEQFFQDGVEHGVNKFIEQFTQGIDEAIRCAMCTNVMANEGGCDGNCVVNQGMYNKIIEIIDNYVEYAKNHVLQELEEDNDEEILEDLFR